MWLVPRDDMANEICLQKFEVCYLNNHLSDNFCDNH